MQNFDYLIVDARLDFPTYIPGVRALLERRCKERGNQDLGAITPWFQRSFSPEVAVFCRPFQARKTP